VKRTPPLALALLAWLVAAAALADGNAGEGKKTYDRHCRECHGATGAGDGPAAAAVDPRPRDFTAGEFKFDADKDGVAGTDEDLFIVIQKGGAPFGGNPVMVPWVQLSDQQIEDLIAYIRSFRNEPATGRR
jgi:mono/diheme cytochrome c family protein